MAGLHAVIQSNQFDPESDPEGEAPEDSLAAAGNDNPARCQMVRSIGQELSARTVDMKWVRRVSNIIWKHMADAESPPLGKSRHHHVWSHLGWGDIFWAFYFHAWFEVLNKHFHKASIFALSYVVKSIQNMKKIH